MAKLGLCKADVQLQVLCLWVVQSFIRRNNRHCNAQLAMENFEISPTLLCSVTQHLSCKLPKAPKTRSKLPLDKLDLKLG